MTPRLFKYRVWHIPSKHMHYSELGNLAITHTIMGDSTGIMVNERLQARENVIIELWSLLYDVKGTKIYEGDIVQFGENKGTVVFDYDGFQVEYIGDGNQSPTYKRLSSIYQPLIIGNIHEEQ